MRFITPVSFLLCSTATAWGWGAQVHRDLTHLALEGLPADAPSWLREPDVRARAAFQSYQADRWRGWPSDTLKHVNDPDHYLDAELLAQFELSLDTLPKLRGEYLRVMAAAKLAHPERLEPYDAAKDPARAHEWPGFVLHAVAEHYAKLQAAFNQVRILEQLDDPARRWQLEQARAIALYHLGELSHFVTDVAQPLHTTRHYNGWVGANPAAYRWRDKFHLYIDEGFAIRHQLSRDALRRLVKYDARVNPADPWGDVLAYFQRSHALMERLYVLERDDRLDTDEGKRLITGQLCDAVAMLHGLILAAYTSAAPTPKQIETWVFYDQFDPNEGAPASATTTQPRLE